MAAWSQTELKKHTDTAKIVWLYLKSKGLNNIACAAIMGNIERESHFIIDNTESGGTGIGLCQWSDTKDSRRATQLKEFAKEQGKDWTDLYVQLDFLWAELTGKAPENYSRVLPMIQSATSIKDATMAFGKVFENPNEKYAEWDERIEYANFWHILFLQDPTITNSYTVTADMADIIINQAKDEDGTKSDYFYKYFEAGYLDIPDELSIAMMDELVKVDPLRRVEPLSVYDYIDYNHRHYSINSIYNLTLGDCSFVIPPQAISIVTESNGQELVTLRQENTQKIRRGYSKKIVSVQLVFHGYNQINGYKVEGPEGYYYVDGLRQLLAQFKCTPFLPISNPTINNLYNIHTVALQSIVCSTVEGFPDMMIANLTLQEVDLYPYLESHTMFYPEFIDWDLFRFYYQRQLTESHEYGKLQSIPVDKSLNKFKISILDESVFNENINYDHDYEKTGYDKNYNLKGKKLNFSFYDVILDRKIVYTDDNGEFHVEDPTEEHPSNFVDYINSETDNIQISSFQCGYSNILTNIQMAEHAHPTVQYMGGMDTMFNITFETMNEDVIIALENCNTTNNRITRDNRDCASLGFIKLESELVELFGSKFVMIDNVTTHTVPEFPGLFICQINCISFDAYQKQKEGINGMSPFEKDGTGTKDNAITQTPAGLKEKVKQDICVETKIRAMTELYPDLKLPTYQEVDEFITKIKTFRETHTNIEGEPLGTYPIDRYPRTPQRMLHGMSKITNLNVDEYGFVTNVPEIIEECEWYNGYVDPDFYVFYPETYKGMMEELKEDIVELGMEYYNPKPKSKTTTRTRTNFGSDIKTDSDISNYDSNLQTQGGTELQIQFVARARSKVGKAYSNDNSGYNNRTGPNAYDCSGLVGKCLQELGVLSHPYITTTQVESLIWKGVFRQKYKSSNITELVAHANPGDLFHIYASEKGTQYGHIAIYAGNNTIIHAKGKKYGVVEETISSANKFMRVLEVPALAKPIQITKQTVTTNEKSNINLSLKIGDEGDDVKQLQKVLNQLDDAALTVDGKFNTVTEKAVKNFQTKHNLTADGNGIVGKETSSKLQELSDINIFESSSKITMTSGKDAIYITESEIMAIAKTIANIHISRPESIQRALAQLIYDRFTNDKAKHGNLNDILDSSIFKGQYDKNLPKSSKAYEIAKHVFCEGDRISDKQLVEYLGPESDSNYSVFDSKYNRIDGDYGDFTFWTNDIATSDKKYILVDDDTEYTTVSSSTIEETHTITNGLTELDASFAKQFGKPILVKSSEMDGDTGWFFNAMNGKTGNQEKAYRKNYNTDSQILMSSFVNQCEYSGRGRLVKAFPTYLFCIVDEDGNWLDGKKLWANYYMLRSIVDIQVASYDDSPISTATVTVTNSYGNLDTLPPNAFYYSPGADEEYGTFRRWLYNTFGMLPGFGPKLTQTLVDQKNIIYDSMVIRAGCRMHLRMGYGSDPLSLPVVMNGYISDLQLGDITQFVCVSDGVELTNAIISDSPKDTNGIFSSQQEASNICTGLLTSRQSWLNGINRNWGEPNKYGIEHFGLYMSERLEFIPTAELGDSNTANAGETILNTIGSAVESIVSFGRGVIDNFVQCWGETQYDLIKNIYRSSYDGSLAMYTPFWGFIDGEKNLCFNLYNKTPWDAIQMGVMNAPEYIGMPLYHQFESRLFFGLPWFLAKYRYNLINDELYEEAKTFAQCHFIDSLTDIIDNQMITTSRDVYTNAIVMYILGKNPKATPTLHSDKSINFSMQSTKIFDSSVTQNIIGPDTIWEWLGLEMGKQGAIRIGISQLLWNWAKAYQGDVILLGDAGINPCDYIYLNDRYNELTGLCTARTVIHSLSARTGFTTTITPGMIGMSTMQESQAKVVLSNIMTVGGAFSYYMSLKKTIKDNADKVSEWYNKCKETAKTYFYIDAGIKTILSTAIIYKSVTGAKNIYDMVKGLKYVECMDELKKLGKFLRNSGNIYKRMKKANQSFKLAKIATKILKLGGTSFSSLFATGAGAAGSVAGPLGTIASATIGFILGFLVDKILNGVIDYFRYNNVLVLLPLMHKCTPYAPILSGERLLLTGSTNTNIDYDNPKESGDTISSELSGASSGEGDPGAELNMSDQSWADKYLETVDNSYGGSVISSMGL